MHDSKKHLFSYEDRLNLKIGNGYEIELKKLTEDAYKFFIELGLTMEILLKYWLYPVKGIIRNGRIIYTSNSQTPIFAYFTSKEHAKIYLPNRPTSKKFFQIGEKNPNEIFAWEHLPKSGKAIFLVGGEKDVMIMTHIVGYPAICANSENDDSNITKQHIDDLKSRFAQVCIMYDNDKTGKDYQQKLSNKYSIMPIDLPEIDNGKDLTDYVAKGYSVDDLRRMIENKISIPEPIWGDDIFDDNAVPEEVVRNNSQINIQEKQAEPKKDEWPSNYFDTLDEIIKKFEKSGHSFIDGARNDYILRVAGACNTKGLPLKFVEKQLDSKLNLTNFDDHLKTLRGIYSRYDESFDKSPIKNNEYVKHETPTFDTQRVEKLPKIFKMLFKRFEDERERDVSIIGLLSLLGAILDGYNVIHQNKRYLTNLFTVISAPFASGKGVLNIIRNIGNPLNRTLAEISRERYKKYQDELQYYKENFKDNPELTEPVIPIMPRLFFGGDMSTASFKDQLVMTNGAGMMFDTEADTITSTLSAEWGDYSVLLRKGLSNETIEFDRKNISREISKPYVSGLISGTVGALLRLIPNSEDGLFSRLIYYVFDKEPTFAQDAFDYKLVDKYDNQEKELSEIIENTFFYFDNMKKKYQTIEFYWDESYQIRLLDTYRNWLNSHLAIIGAAGSRVLFRLGNMATRIAAILTVFRLMENGEIINPHNLDILFENQSKVRITCTEEDFDATMHLMDIIRQHTFHVYENLSEDQQNKPMKSLKTHQINFLEALSKEFQRKEAVDIGGKQGIKERTVDKHLKTFVDLKILARDDKGGYMKLI